MHSNQERKKVIQMEENGKQTFKGEEREITKKNGFGMLAVVLIGFLACVGGYIGGGFAMEAKSYPLGVTLFVVASVGVVVFSIMCAGFHVVNPNEAVVLTLFGQYYGTIKQEGFYFVNPFTSSMQPGTGKNGGLSVKLEETPEISVSSKKKVSLKTMTLNNKQQKVNDALGNPIIIGAIVIWKVVNPTKALFNVDDYGTFLSIQCDSTIRNITRLYPYDLMDEEDDNSENSHEKTLRGSSQEIAESMKAELGKRVEEAGIVVEEIRITHLSYAEEIAAAMLQKQQAAAVIAARKKIVEGAVGMVDMAIEQLGEKEVVVLDEERKAAMVSNLLVVLCGHQEAQPIVNSGSIY